MREKKSHLYVDGEERKLLLHSLVGLKNQLIQQGRYTDYVDELIFMVIHAPLFPFSFQAFDSYALPLHERITHQGVIYRE